jgi:hypothetical protein
VTRCPRCNGPLATRMVWDNESLWQVDRQGVVISCRRQLILADCVTCAVCSYREVVDVKRTARPRLSSSRAPVSTDVVYCWYPAKRKRAWLESYPARDSRRVAMYGER